MSTHINKGETFHERVYDIVRLIPKGRVTTYGAIARYLHSKSSRAVGWALNLSHTMEGIPAHRVVNKFGILSGKKHFPRPMDMETRLLQEGVKVDDDRVVDFEKLFWDPSVEFFNW